MGRCKASQHADDGGSMLWEKEKNRQYYLLWRRFGRGCVGTGATVSKGPWYAKAILQIDGGEEGLSAASLGIEKYHLKRRRQRTSHHVSLHLYRRLNVYSNVSGRSIARKCFHTVCRSILDAFIRSQAFV